MNSYTYEEIQIGMEASFEVEITESMQKMFLELSGDNNPMHVDVTYAKARNYKDRLVYGMCTASFYSKLVGVYLPGEKCLFRECDIQWPKPVYIGDKLTIYGKVKEKDDRTRVIKIKAYIRNQNNEKVSRAILTVGVLEV